MAGNVITFPFVEPRVGKFMTQCKKTLINPGFMTSCHKQVYGGLWHDSVKSIFLYKYWHSQQICGIFFLDIPEK